MTEKISLNRQSELFRILKDPVYAEHLINFDLSNLYSVIGNLSEKQYKYILYLMIVKKWLIIKNILSNSGLKNK